jgi:uncharacterized membrane protein YvbJ
MQRTCLKCGFANDEAEGGNAEACPKCGVVYFKIESARNNAARQASREREKPGRDRSTLVSILAGGGAVASVVLVILILMVIFAVGHAIVHLLSSQGGHA